MQKNNLLKTKRIETEIQVKWEYGFHI